MPQSLVKNYVHLVFSTKHRQPLITKKIQPELYAYMGGICSSLECYPRAIGGVEDHVHILCLLSQKIALMKLLEKVKSKSSRWIKTKGEEFEGFYWQNGYGAFSVNPTQEGVVKRYIQNQEEHHKNKTFKTEFRYFLNKYKLEYDERYVWD
ncbi:MAG: IS200/IS605 family transposase [Chitinophagales bacterium]